MVATSKLSIRPREKGETNSRTVASNSVADREQQPYEQQGSCILVVQTRQHIAPHSLSSLGGQTPTVPFDVVRTFIVAGKLSPRSFLDLTSTSYKVTGFSPVNPHPVNGVSKPTLHFPPSGLIRATYVIGDFHSASMPPSGTLSMPVNMILKVLVFASHVTGGLFCVPCCQGCCLFILRLFPALATCTPPSRLAAVGMPLTILPSMPTVLPHHPIYPANTSYHRDIRLGG